MSKQTAQETEKQTTWQEEMDAIRAKHAGLLRVRDVIEVAKDPQTALHEQFTWDEHENSEKWLEHQARQLIEVYVKIIPTHNEPVRPYVSLYTDRKQEGGGYRTIEDVMSSKELRDQFLSQAIAEYRRLEEKYRQLKALAPVFKVVHSVEKKHLKQIKSGTPKEAAA